MRGFHCVAFRHSPYHPLVIRRGKSGQFCDPRLTVGWQMNTGQHFFRPSVFLQQEEVGGHFYRIRVKRPSSRAYFCPERRQAVFHTRNRPLQGKLQAFLGQGERGLGCLRLTGCRHDRHLHHLAHAEPCLYAFYLPNRHRQRKPSVLSGIYRIERKLLFPIDSPVKGANHGRRSRHAGVSQRCPVVVHGHTRQVGRVARKEMSAQLIQTDRKRRTLVFLNPKNRAPRAGLQHIIPRQSGRRQGKGRRKRTIFITLHGLFGYGLPIRVLQYQYHLTLWHTPFLGKSRIETQAARIHRLPGTVDGTVGI